MAGRSRLPVSTASKEQSVWRDLDQDTFRRHIIDLQRASNEVPADPMVHSATDWQANHSIKNKQERILPFEVEQQIADDIAFVAATEEGHKEISAVTLEEQVEPDGLVVRLAANEVISKGIQTALEAMFDLLKRCAVGKLSRESCAEALIETVIHTNENRIHGRLESVHWKIPRSRVGYKTRRPLHKGLQKLSSDLASSQSVHPEPRSVLLIDRMAQLREVFRKVDHCPPSSDDRRRALENAIKQSHDLCTSGGASTMEETVLSYGFRPSQASSNKLIRQLDKLGRYWGLCKALAEDSRKYRDIFSNVKLQCEAPYEAKNSSIAFVPGQNARCLVHAEIQLLIFYSARATKGINRPRVIGVSKACCYLCNLFIISDDQFFITKTHGRLHERWTFPDILEFSQREREKYSRILKAMDQEMLIRSKVESEHPQKRQRPMGSWLALPSARISSPAPSTIMSSSGQEDGDNQDEPQVNDAFPPGSKTSLRHISPRSSTSGSPYRSLGFSDTRHATIIDPPAIITTNRDIDYATSMSSIASWEYPCNRAITASSPLRTTHGNVSLVLEIEEPSCGNVTIERSARGEASESGGFVDLHALKPGEERIFLRDEKDDSMILNLRQSQQHFMKLSLQWR